MSDTHSSTTPALVYVSPEADEAAFRAELRAFMKDTREQLKDLKSAVDLLLAAKALDDG